MKPTLQYFESHVLLHHERLQLTKDSSLQFIMKQTENKASFKGVWSRATRFLYCFNFEQKKIDQ